MDQSWPQHFYKMPNQANLSAHSKFGGGSSWLGQKGSLFGFSHSREHIKSPIMETDQQSQLSPEERSTSPSNKYINAASHIYHQTPSTPSQLMSGPPFNSPFLQDSRPKIPKSIYLRDTKILNPSAAEETSRNSEHEQNSQQVEWKDQPLTIHSIRRKKGINRFGQEEKWEKELGYNDGYQIKVGATENGIKEKSNLFNWLDESLEKMSCICNQNELITSKRNELTCRERTKRKMISWV